MVEKRIFTRNLLISVSYPQECPEQSSSVWLNETAFHEFVFSRIY